MRWELILGANRMQEGLHFLRILGANTPPMDVGDWMRWKLKPNGEFDIWSYYNNLRAPPSIVFPWKGIWRVKAPRLVSIFVWCVAWNKILTGDNLRRLRGLDFVDQCIMCRIVERRQIIYFFIVRWLIGCGALS